MYKKKKADQPSIYFFQAKIYISTQFDVKKQK